VRRREDGRRGAVTIADVAEAAGVATSTVSRALTQPGRVSAELQRHVQAVAASLGYRANPQARSLTSGRTQSFALLIPGATNPYFFDLIRGTQTEAKVRGYRHVLIDTEGSAEIEATVMAELPGAVDGAVVAGSRLSDADLAEISRRLPLVVVNREIEGVPSVVVDTSEAVRQAVEYLVALGHRRIAYLGGPEGSWSNVRRWEAVERATTRLGVDCLHLGSYTTLHTGAAAADAAIHHRVTASLFFNDMIALGALKRFAERGVAVPRDMSVIGCDDIFGADFCNPPLTTLTAPIDEVARMATDMLLTRLLGLTQIRQRERVLARLTVRQSTGTAPTAPA
jgi:LacI family transcriptional regulator